MKETRTPAIADESRRFPCPRVLSNLGAKFLSVSNNNLCKAYLIPLQWCTCMCYRRWIALDLLATAVKIGWLNCRPCGQLISIIHKISNKIGDKAGEAS